MKKDNHKKLAQVKLTRFVRRGIDFKILKLGTKGDLLEVIVQASKNGVELPVNNPLYYKNPPVKMTAEKDEDHREVLKEIICQVVER